MSMLILAKIISQEKVAPGHYLLTFLAPEMARTAQPGQFVQVRCGDTLDPLLRRPLSLHGIDRAVGTLTLLYRVVGRGTEILSRMQAGEVLDVMGPLGRGFILNESSPESINRDESEDLKQGATNLKLVQPVAEAIVVGGGLGVAPLLPLVESLVQQGVPVTVILGARSADGLLRVEAFENTGAKVEIATDDGSRGTLGTAVDLLKKRIEQEGFNQDQQGAGIGSLTGSLDRIGVYSCGPAPMLRAVWKLCTDYQVPLQVSLEERMGCGVGACLACVCKVKLNPKNVEMVKGSAIKATKAAEALELSAASEATKVSEVLAISKLPAGPGPLEWKYARVCVEGPVFWGEEVILDEQHG
jgi:dihydroorotate dehydrogenase electron transfer subunit